MIVLRMEIWKIQINMPEAFPFSGNLLHYAWNCVQHAANRHDSNDTGKRKHILELKIYNYLDERISGWVDRQAET